MTRSSQTTYGIRTEKGRVLNAAIHLLDQVTSSKIKLKCLQCDHQVGMRAIIGCLVDWRGWEMGEA